MNVRNGLFGLRGLAIAGLAVGMVSCEEPPAGEAPGTESAGTSQPPGSPSTTAPSGAPAVPGPGVGDAGSPGTTTPDAAASPWCSAQAVLQTACQTCHGTVPAGSPMSLVTYEDTQQRSILDPTKTIVEAIKARIHDSARPMPPVAKPPLTTEQLAALDAWLAAGAPNGTCATPEPPPPKPTEEFEWPAECEEIYKVQAHQNGGPYRVPANYEGNVQITIPVPWAGKGSGPVHALAIRPLTNNTRVVHHWILYASTSQFITSWSPGKEAETFPEDVGVYMPTEGTFRLNMHYYNVGNASAELDQSGLEVCVTRKLRPKTATTNMFGPLLLSVPGTGMSSAVATCTQGGTKSVTLITSSPHMHSYGIAAKFEIIHPDGSVEVLDDAPFNWEDQSIKPILKVVNPGDKVRTTCIYNNTTGRTVRFGESSEDEMCFNFARYYPMGDLSCRSGF